MEAMNAISELILAMSATLKWIHLVESGLLHFYCAFDGTMIGAVGIFHQTECHPVSFWPVLLFQNYPCHFWQSASLFLVHTSRSLFHEASLHGRWKCRRLGANTPQKEVQQPQLKSLSTVSVPPFFAASRSTAHSSLSGSCLIFSLRTER